jgi:hypothetical protein
MTARKLDRSRAKRALWISFAALVLAVPVAQAQQPAARVPRPIYRTYQRPMTARPVARPVMRPVIRPFTQTMIARPMAVRPLMRPQVIPVRRPGPPTVRPLPRTSAVRTYPAPQTFASRPFAPYRLTRPALPSSNAFRPRAAWIGARGYFNSYLFGGAFVNDYGYWQTPSNYQMLPLGFGMWPACDSASIPGRFWTVGPCFGAGDYQSLATNYQNELLAETAPPYYQPPLEFIVQPQAAPSSAKTQPSQPEKKPNMVVCLTNGSETEVSDWWVTQGRFYFIPVNGPSNGKTQTVDLNALDLQKTIEENEKRGRTFILNFTPPDERPTSPAP